MSKHFGRLGLDLQRVSEPVSCAVHALDDKRGEEPDEDEKRQTRSRKWGGRLGPRYDKDQPRPNASPALGISVMIPNPGSSPLYDEIIVGRSVGGSNRSWNGENLIVDEEPLITEMMEEWLSELGHDVVGPAHNLAQALELAESDIDTAIVDVSLGKDNSYSLADA